MYIWLYDRLSFLFNYKLFIKYRQPYTVSKELCSFSFTSSELQAMKTGSCIWDGTIKTDWYYAYTQKYYFNTEPFDTEMYDDNFSVLKGSSLILVREYILNNPFSFRNSIKLLDYDLNMKLEKSGFSSVYDNGLVEGYI